MAGRDFTVCVNIAGKILPSLDSAANKAKSTLSGMSSHFKAQASAQRAAIAGIGESFKGVMAIAGAGGIAMSIKKMLGDGEDLAHELQGLRNAGRSAKEVADGMAEANKVIRDMPTGNLTNAIKLLNETTGAFGDYHHAVENLSFNSKLGDVLKNTIGVDDPAHAIGSLIKALEIRGSAANPEKYRREAGGLQKAMTFFGGRLTPDMIYDFASNAQTGVRQLNERFLTKIAPSLIQEMGGAKVGTGLTAFRTIISGRKISDIEQAKAWANLGLLNMKEVKHNKAGQVTGWRDGAIKGTRLAYADPLQYMESVILPRLKARGTDIADPIKLGAALTTLFKNTKANAFVTAISTVVDRARLKKDEKLIEQVLDTDKNYDESLLNDPKLARFTIVQAMKNLGASLSTPLMKPLAQTLIAIARGVNALSASLMEHPGAARALSSLVVALSGLAMLRLANVVFGITAIARGLGYLALSATFGLASGLVAVARGIVAVSLAATVGLARRLALSAAALMMLGRVGGARLVLSTFALGLAGMGRAVLTFPLVALRAVGVALWGLAANPIGIAIAAIVVALTALGVWVSNNWSGLKSFFVAFGETFTKNLGPGPASAVNGIVSALKGVWDWFSKILGAIDESGVKWIEWGAAAGRGCAAVVNAIAGLPGKIKDFFVNAFEQVRAIDWGDVGDAIVNGIIAGIAQGADRIAGAIKSAVAGAGSAIGDAAGGAWNGMKRGAKWLKEKTFGPSLPGRAMGGPVIKGLSYLVGERGPELFTPHESGSIRTNGYLSGLGGVGGPSVDMSGVSRAAQAARQTGEVFHASLDTTTRPIVDTSGIDEATEKASKLASIISSIGGSSINLGGLGAIGGGGAGGGGGGSWNGKTLLVGEGAGIGHTASQAERAAFIKSYAASIGMDPATALRVAQSEGFNKYTGDHGRSFGDFQLFTGGGVGNRALRAGINVRDPRQWKAADKFALDTAKHEGWAQWHGARRVGIGNWHGIRGARAGGGPVDGGGTYLVGEKGPELFTPGASGHVTSNSRMARLLAGAEAVAKTRGAAAAASRPVQHTRGDTHISNEWHIHGAHNTTDVKRQVEKHFETLMRQMESDQRGLLSD